MEKTILTNHNQPPRNPFRRFQRGAFETTLGNPTSNLAQPAGTRRRKRRPFEVNPPEGDFEANEAILRDAGFTYDPDPMGRLGQGIWTDAQGQVLYLAGREKRLLEARQPKPPPAPRNPLTEKSFHDRLGDAVKSFVAARKTKAKTRELIGNDRGGTTRLRQLASSRSQLSQTPAPKPPSTPTGQSRAQKTKPLFQRFLKNLAPREGGIANRGPSVDPGGPTNKGISQKELDRLRITPRWKQLPPQSKTLNNAQIENIYRKEYFERAQIEKLSNVPGLSKVAPKLAEQVFDAGVQHGIQDPGKWLQQALDETIGTDLRVSGKSGGKMYDGIVGTDTRAALEQAVRAGKANEINDKIVDKRVQYMKSLSNSGPNKGWIFRAESFRSKPGNP